jgi:ice-binding like protein
MKTRFRGLALAVSASLALTLAIGLLGTGRTASAAGPSPVGLGTAAAFAVLAGTPAVTNTGATTITGDLGIHPAAAVTGFPPGIVNGTIHAADAVALQAKNDLVSAYVDAAGRPATATHGTLGGLTLVGGVYNAGGVTLGLTGTLTLDGQNDPSSVWIFQATSDLITASSSSVSFINGAQPCNVFWQVTSSATLGSGSTFGGTILALTSITMNSGVSVNGRALARNGDVTLINDAITRSTCAVAATATPAPTVTPTAAPTVAPTVAPTAAPTVAPTPAPIAVPIAAATPTPVVASLPSTATDGDNTLVFLILPIVIVAFLGLYLVARARRRRARPAA